MGVNWIITLKKTSILNSTNKASMTEGNLKLKQGHLCLLATK